MPNYHMFAGGFAELGTGAPGNDGRATANLNKMFYDTSGFLYVLKSNGEAASRVAFAPTIVDFTNTDNRDQVCIQPAANRIQAWAGLWAASVQDSTATDDTDLQMVLYRGSASAAPLESGAAHSANNTSANMIPNAGADEFDSTATDATGTNYADESNGRFAYPAAGDIASNAETANVYFALTPL